MVLLRLSTRLCPGFRSSILNRRLAGNFSAIKETSTPALSDEVLGESNSLHSTSEELLCPTQDDNVTFRSLGIDWLFTRKLRSIGIVKPTHIQAKAIPLIASYTNTVLNTETGSGKTLGYALPLVQDLHDLQRTLRSDLARPHIIVIVPGMELAHQVANVFQPLLALIGLEAAIVHNNSPLKLTPSTAVLIATAYSLSNYKLDYFADTQVLVVDEADVVLMRGRKDPMPSIMNYFCSKSSFNCKSGRFVRQFVFAGATFPERGEKTALPLIKQWVGDTHVIRSDLTHRFLDNLVLEFHQVQNGTKMRTLIARMSDLQRIHKDGLKVLVFVNTLEAANSLYSQIAGRFDSDAVSPLSQQPFASAQSDVSDFRRFWRDKASVIHKGVSFDERMEALEKFSVSEFYMLVTTDILARGLDIPGVDVVVQYDAATNVINMIHRAGRTGRMGCQGRVISFVTEKDQLLCDAFKLAAPGQQSLEPLFSRRRSFKRNVERGHIAVPDVQCD